MELKNAKDCLQYYKRCLNICIYIFVCCETNIGNPNRIQQQPFIFDSRTGVPGVRDLYSQVTKCNNKSKQSNDNLSFETQISSL